MDWCHSLDKSANVFICLAVALYEQYVSSAKLVEKQIVNALCKFL